MAEIEDKEAVITIKVKLVSDVEGDLGQQEGAKERPDFFGQKAKDESEDSHIKDDPDFNKLIDELLEEQIKDVIEEEVQNSVDDSIEEALQKSFGIDTTQLENMTDLIGNLDKQGITQLTQFAKSPESFMANGFMKLLSAGGPYGAVVVAIITAVLASPELAKALVEMLGVKGGPLNQDFRYAIDEQENQQFDRVLQFRRLTGDDPVITVTTKGFVVGDPDFVGSSLLSADIARTARIGLRESSLGVINGI